MKRFTSILTILVLLIGSVICQDHNRLFDYIGVHRKLAERLDRCHDLLNVTTPARAFRQDLTPDTFEPSGLKCGTHRCVTPIVSLGRPGKNKPEIFLAAGLNGRDHLGPTVLLSFIDLVCDLYPYESSIHYLMEKYLIWILPMANPWGYHNNKTLEVNVNPSLDFPYMKSNNQCLMSATSRTIYEIFRARSIALSIVFDTEIRRPTLTYPWASLYRTRRDFISPKVYYEPMPSVDAPDNSTFAYMAHLLQEAAGKQHIPYITSEENSEMEEFEVKTNEPISYYTVASTSFGVFPANGALVDWAYGAGWSDSEKLVTCKTESFGYNFTERNAKLVNRAASFLVRASLPKNATQKSLGNPEEISKKPNTNDSVISRNIRLILKALEMVSSELLSVKPVMLEILETGYVITGAVLPIGCDVISKIDFEIADISTGEVKTIPLINKPRKCQRIGLWEKQKDNPFDAYWRHSRTNLTQDPHVISFTINLERIHNKTFHIRADFDETWQKQESPVPNIKPVTRLTRYRHNQLYDIILNTFGIQFDTERYYKIVKRKYVDEP